MAFPNSSLSPPQGLCVSSPAPGAVPTRRGPQGLHRQLLPAKGGVGQRAALPRRPRGAGCSAPVAQLGLGFLEEQMSSLNWVPFPGRDARTPVGLIPVPERKYPSPGRKRPGSQGKSHTALSLLLASDDLGAADGHAGLHSATATGARRKVGWEAPHSSLACCLMGASQPCCMRRGVDQPHLAGVRSSRFSALCRRADRGCVRGRACLGEETEAQRRTRAGQVSPPRSMAGRSRKAARPQSCLVYLTSAPCSLSLPSSAAPALPATGLPACSLSVFIPACPCHRRPRSLETKNECQLMDKAV
nr:PREDICTED: uncharacterized protein LOC103567295 isoform X2 [Equus przewalskii]